MNWRKHWPVIRRLLTIAFIGAVVALLGNYLGDIEWRKVAASLRAQKSGTLVIAMLLTGASHLVYSCYDLLGRIYVRHHLPRLRVMATAFVSYAFNLNFGAWIGGIGFRYRLYSRAGLAGGRITRILGLSMLTNWLGYFCLAGVVFLMRYLPLPPAWGIGLSALQVLGGLLLVAAAGYLALCAFSPKRKWIVRSAEIHLPSLPVAVTQFSLSIVNWLLIAAIFYVVLDERVPFPTVLAVMLMSSIAGVITHIPGGLGVIEAVFIMFLGRTIPQSELLASLLVYRSIYYLMPLLAGIAVYLLLEARTTKAGHPTKSHRAPAR